MTSFSNFNYMNHLAAFRAYGPDTATFLQSQLTQDISNLSHESYTYAGYCSAKGRLLVNFIVWARQAGNSYRTLASC